MIRIFTSHLICWISNSIDENLEIAGELCDEDKLSNYKDENPDDYHSEAESEKDSNDSASAKVPTNKEMLQALAVLKAGVVNLSSKFQIQCDYENFILN